MTKAPSLGREGLRLWGELGGDDALGADRVLIVSACRIVDRLERLDRVLRGDESEWLRFALPDEDSEIVLTIDNAVGNERMLSLALKQILTELRQARAAAAGSPTGGAVPATPAAPDTTTGGGKVSSLGDLSARIQARLDQLQRTGTAG
ncbi:hypothetical protein [Catellatospora sp. NPDC049609]|uniref:hypothetical protein n=1 Tax=Catellatospora sp. NPDC049609 TaxID=3155505 RepID=UPI00342361AF